MVALVSGQVAAMIGVVLVPLFGLDSSSET